LYSGQCIVIEELIGEVVGMDGLTINRPVDVSNSRGAGPALLLQAIVSSGEYMDLGIMSGNRKPVRVGRESHLADAEDLILPSCQFLDDLESFLLLEGWESINAD
jgi:hypothetical protein